MTVGSATVTASTSTGRWGSPSRSDTASTSVSAPRWPVSRAGLALDEVLDRVPVVGGRLGSGPNRPHLDGPRLGDPPGGHGMTGGVRRDRTDRAFGRAVDGA